MAIARLLLLLLLLERGSGEEDAKMLCSGTACYTLHLARLDWNAAQEQCELNGGNLSPARSPAEAELLRELLMAAGGTDQAWIGLSLQRGRCVQPQEPLRGFSWVSSGEPGNYSAWLSEPRFTCLSTLCVSLRPAGWVSRPCRILLPAFLCKFSFRGMCGPLPLGGPGRVSYTTPFGVRSPQLAAAPFGTLAEAQCDGDDVPTFTVCKSLLEGGSFTWDTPGPLCPIACAHHNGGCQHRCLEEPGQPPRCACHPGYTLAPDMASCLPEDACHPNPCQGTCRTRHGSFECVCEAGYTLASDGRRCLDVDECLSGPCQHECRNTVGSFICLCRPGYQHQPGGGDACLDVDECLQDPCPGPCHNLPGSFKCLCPPGFILEEDGRGCYSAPTHKEETMGSPNSTSRTTGNPPTTDALQTTGILQTTGAPWTSGIPWTLGIPVGATPPAPTVAGSAPGPEHSADGPRLLLYYILGSLVAILLVLAFALALLACKRRVAKQEKQPAKNAADNYCWVPEQPESCGAGGERR
ncbi:complement component C1q receptor [Phaenicophaeus curvirostris]|uniref:complement component C1q receptor n=1 Tax=Phaenicophaeus curvirostris TaxID=33595 RepID=UPI0037F0A5FE